MNLTSHSYFVTMIDYGRKGREAIVDPEITRREVIARVRSGEYPRDRIVFIHYITMNDVPADVTAEICAEAFQLDGSDGPAPNRAMKLVVQIDETLHGAGGF